MPEPELAGLRVLVTRPADQADDLCRLIGAAGGIPVRLPTLEILLAADPPAVHATLERLDRYSLAIFVSANAVEHFVAMLDRQALPQSLRLAAVGRRTAQALTQHLHRPIITPATEFNSEGLLALPELSDVAGHHVLIVRGDGGRELLGETLRARGAAVDYIEVYRRGRPAGDLRPVQDNIDFITTTSNEALQNLFDMAANEEQRAWLRSLPLLVFSRRGIELARRLGFHNEVRMVSQASDAGIIETLCAWRRERG